MYVSSKRKCRIVFRDYDNRTLKELSLLSGEAILDQATDAPLRESVGLSSYAFAGWTPSLDSTAPVRGDVIYTASYQRKTKTGISVEHERSHPVESALSAADVRAYPVYEVHGPAGTLLEKAPDKGRPIDAADICLSGDGVAKGENEIEVRQISTGFAEKISIYGSFIDGIIATPKSSRAKAGSRLRQDDFDVYFTVSRIGKDGRVEKRAVDRERKAARFAFSGGLSYVTVAAGDNSIKITEQETGQRLFCVAHVIGEGKSDAGQPKDEETKPDGELRKKAKAQRP